jgi:hypothetical protein
LGEKYRSFGSSLCSFLHSSVNVVLFVALVIPKYQSRSKAFCVNIL